MTTHTSPDEGTNELRMPLVILLEHFLTNSLFMAVVSCHCPLTSILYPPTTGLFFAPKP